MIYVYCASVAMALRIMFFSRGASELFYDETCGKLLYGGLCCRLYIYTKVFGELMPINAIYI